MYTNLHVCVYAYRIMYMCMYCVCYVYMYNVHVHAMNMLSAYVLGSTFTHVQYVHITACAGYACAHVQLCVYSSVYLMHFPATSLALHLHDG